MATSPLFTHPIVTNRHGRGAVDGGNLQLARMREGVLK